MSPIVTALVGAGAGAAAGVLSSFGLRQVSFGTPKIRAGAQMVAGIVAGVLIGMKNPAIGASVGTGIVTAGTVSMADAFGLGGGASASAPKQLAARPAAKQLKGLYDDPDNVGAVYEEEMAGVDDELGAVVDDDVGDVLDDAYG